MTSIAKEAWLLAAKIDHALKQFRPHAERMRNSHDFRTHTDLATAQLRKCCELSQQFEWQQAYLACSHADQSLNAILTEAANMHFPADSKPALLAQVAGLSNLIKAWQKDLSDLMPPESRQMLAEHREQFTETGQSLQSAGVATF